MICKFQPLLILVVYLEGTGVPTPASGITLPPFPILKYNPYSKVYITMSNISCTKLLWAYFQLNSLTNPPTGVTNIISYGLFRSRFSNICLNFTKLGINDVLTMAIKHHHFQFITFILKNRMNGRTHEVGDTNPKTSSSKSMLIPLRTTQHIGAALGEIEACWVGFVLVGLGWVAQHVTAHPHPLSSAALGEIKQCWFVWVS
jgi:hypothetical protein